MREIKFRAWHKNSKKIYPVVWIALDTGEIELDVGEDDSCWYRQKGIELMQFTGLQDTNGKEIYEGDIITFIWDNRKWTQKVIFSNCGFYPAQFDIGLGEFPLINIEVIGNIYENPELLKGA